MKNRLLTKYNTLTHILVLTLTILMALGPDYVAWAGALPVGGKITSGSGSISIAGKTMTVKQSTSNIGINWSSFNVGQGYTIKYLQPSSSSIASNFVSGTSASTIAGAISSIGKVFIFNPYGIFFAGTSSVDVGGLLAAASKGMSTTGGMTVTGNVSNAGTIDAASGGYVVLAGNAVDNSGTVSAPKGLVAFGAGNSVVVDFSGNTILGLNVNSNTVESVIDNGGVISANGGTVSLTSGAQDSLVKSVVNNTGIIEAQTMDDLTGTISLRAGMQDGAVTVGGTLDASAPNGGNGGSVVIDASGVVMNNPTINVSAPYGTAGTVKIDPNYILSGTTLDICNPAGLESVDNNQSSLTIGTTTTVPLTDTINLEENMNLATGGTPYNWIPFGTNLSAYATNSLPAFSGTFNGNGHTVSGYTITMNCSQTCAHDGWGFIGFMGPAGQVENLAVTGTINTVGSGDIGGLVGINWGTIRYSYNTGAINGGSSPGGVGGLVGFNGDTGTIEYSYATGNVTTTGSSQTIGGLVGSNCGIIKYSYATGNVTGTTFVGGLTGANDANTGSIYNSYATGIVTVNSGGVDGGGLIGINCGTISNSYWNTTATATGIGGFSSGGTSAGATGLTASAFGSSSSFPGWSFNTWSSGAFTTAATTAPWFEGSVTYGTGTMNAPMLVPDLATATVTGGGTSVYNGSSVTTGYTTTYTMGGSSLPSGITVSTSPFGPNAGTYTVTPSVTGTISQPTSQTSVYSIFTSGSGTWTITPASLSLSTTATKTYDGTATLSVNGTDANFSGFVGSQSASLNGTVDGTLSSANVGSNIGGTIALTASDLTGSGGFLASNYNLPTTFTGGSITAANLSLSTTATKVYDGSNAVSLSSSDTTFSGIVSGQTGELGTTVSGTLNSSNVGNNLGGTVSLSNTNMTGNSSFTSALNAGDYILPSTFAGGNITPAPLTVTTTATKTYDGNANITLATSDSSITGTISGQSASLNSNLGGTFSSSNVGNNIGGTTTATFSDLTGNSAFNSAVSAGDYVIQGTFSGGNITPVALSMTTSATKTYDGTTSIALTGSNTTLNGIVSGQSGTVSGTVNGALSSSNVGGNIGGTLPALASSNFSGTGGFTSAVSAGDYTLPTTFSGGSITPATLTLSTTGTKVYNGNGSLNLATSDTSVNGVVSGQTASLSSTVSGTLSSPNVGTNIGGTSSVSPSDLTGNSTFSSAMAAGDYIVGNSFSGGSVTPATLVLSAYLPSSTFQYMGTTSVPLDNSDSSATLSGFVSGQGASYTGTTGALSNPNVGTQTLSATFGINDFRSNNGTLITNYQVSNVNKTASVNIIPAALSLSTDASKKYDGTKAVVLDGSNTTLGGVIDGSGGLGTGVEGEFFSANPGTNIGGTVSLTRADMTGNSAFINALNNGDYTLPSIFSGGTITSVSPTTISFSDPSGFKGITITVAPAPGEPVDIIFSDGEGPGTSYTISGSSPTTLNGETYSNSNSNFNSNSNLNSNSSTGNNLDSNGNTNTTATEQESFHRSRNGRGYIDGNYVPVIKGLVPIEKVVNIHGKNSSQEHSKKNKNQAHSHKNS